ncbi:divergent polysaccharide deacetylase family protein [Pseudomonas sp. DC3000-4b1]|uniref:divergent polysaccharide deacetylase family protein n=1 Tax=unclassified Pseudomonas TaxID=196821 RepID=UPI003CE92A55
MRAWLLACLLALSGAGQALAASGPAYLSLIIDDLGQTPSRDSRALALPGPVTLAVMPDTPHAAEFARQAHKAGKTVIVHMPMDPAGGPFAWRPGLSSDQLRERLAAAFKSVPFAAGLNNHEGSRMTAQADAMALLAKELQQRGLFLVDSRTSAATQAAAQAQAIGLASVSRDVFLDDVRTPEAIAQQLEHAVALADKQGSVVVIGHPYPQTLDVLEHALPTLKARGIEMISIRQMIGERSNRAMSGHGKGGIYPKGHL